MSVTPEAADLGRDTELLADEELATWPVWENICAYCAQDVYQLVANLRASRAEVKRLREELEEAYQRQYELANGS